MFENKRDLEGNLELMQFPPGHKKSSRQHHSPEIIWFTATAPHHTAEEGTLGAFQLWMTLKSQDRK